MHLYQLVRIGPSCRPDVLTLEGALQDGWEQASAPSQWLSCWVRRPAVALDGVGAGEAPHGEAGRDVGERGAIPTRKKKGTE